LTSALRWGWVVSTTPRPLYSRERPVPIVQEAGWAPGPVWTGVPRNIPKDNIKMKGVDYKGLGCVYVANI
jgi:hypothetical protein